MYTKATHVLRNAFVHIMDKTCEGDEEDQLLLEPCAMLLGRALLLSGRAGEAEAHIREFLDDHRSKGRLSSLDGKSMLLMLMGLHAEALLMQGRKKKR